MARRRAFTSLEMMVCLGLLLAMAGLTARSFLGTGSTIKQDALAALSAEIRSQQQRAMQENKFVALTMVGPNSRKLGVEVGLSQPKLEKVRDFGSDFPDCWLSAATPSQLTSPDPRLSDSWFRQQRVALIFTPSGRLYSNLAPDGSGAYHLSLSRGGGGRWDVRLESQGDLRILPLSTASSALPSFDTSLSVSASANTAPQIKALDVLTSATQNRDTNGVLHLTPAPGQLLTFRVQAEDADGDDQLFVKGTGDGQFSSALASPMSYDAPSQRWVGFVTWQPPTSVSAGSELQFEVTDRSGALAGSNANSHAILDGVAQEFLVFGAQLSGDPKNRIYRCNPDGSGRLPVLAPDYDLAGPSVSPNGTMVAYWSCASWPPNLCVAGLNGTGVRTLATAWPQNGSMGIFWSADSSKVIASRATQQIVAYPAAGGAPTVLVSGTAPNLTVSSPDHRKLAYYRTGVTPPRVEILDLDTLTQTVVANEPAGARLMMSSCDSPLAFSSDSNTLFYCQYDNVTQNATVYSYTAPGPPTLALDAGGRVLWMGTGPGKKLALVNMSSRKLWSWEDYTDPSTKKLVASRVSNSIYAGAPDRFEISQDGQRIYWMQGMDTGSKFMRYSFDGSSSLELCPVGTCFNYPDSNRCALFQPSP